jgi:hypothetical protein
MLLQLMNVVVDPVSKVLEESLDEAPKSCRVWDSIRLFDKSAVFLFAVPGNALTLLSVKGRLASSRVGMSCAL